MQARLCAPVDDEHLARCPHAGPTSPVVVGPPGPLGLGHEPSEVAGRAGIPAGLGFWQQALGRYARRSPAHPLGDDIGYDVEVVMAGNHCRAWFEPLAQDGPLDCLVGDTADGGGAPIAAHCTRRCTRRSCPCVPSQTSMECPPGGRCGSSTDTVAAGRARPGGCLERGGDFYLATLGDIYLATRGEFFMAM